MRLKRFFCMLTACMIAGICIACLLSQPRIKLTGFAWNQESTLSEYTLEAVAALKDTDNVFFDQVYTADISYPLGRDETLVLIPYVRCELRDVPTAGAAYWYSHAGIFAMLWQDGVQVSPDHIYVEDALFSMTADPNTSLQHKGPTLQEELSGNLENPDGTGCFYQHIDAYVSTKNSTVGENAVCSSAIHWEGTCGIKRIWKPSVFADFCMDYDFRYINNVRGQ